MKRTANVIGATGLVGKQLVQLLLENPAFEKVRIFVRRDTGILHARLEQKIVDFADPQSWKKYLAGDILFSALGTTLKQAGSKEKQYEVDYTFNYNFARQAKENGITSYVLVSSIGANAASKIFYSRIKGELDAQVLNLGFDNMAILRPASLTGEREENRTMEKLSVPVLKTLTRFVLKDYRPISDITVARAMINAALHPRPDKKIWEGSEVFKLAEHP